MLAPGTPETTDNSGKTTALVFFGVFAATLVVIFSLMREPKKKAK